MSRTDALTVTLPPEMVSLVEQKVRSGAYASASDVIRDGLQALQDRDASLEEWLRDDVLKGHAEYAADPSRAVPAEDVVGRIRAKRIASAK